MQGKKPNHIPKESYITALLGRAAVYNLTGKAKIASDDTHTALEVSKQIGNRAAEVQCLLQLSSVYASLCQFDEMRVIAQECLALCKTMHDQKGIADSANIIGNVQFYTGNYRNALLSYEKSLRMRKRIRDRFGQATSRTNIGLVHYQLGNYDIALDYYDKALRISNALGDRRGQAHTLTNIGFVCVQQARYNAALSYYRRALTIRQGVGDRQGYACNLAHIGIVHSSRNEHRAALDYFLKALAIFKETGDRRNQAYVFMCLGSTHLAFGDHTNALEDCRKAYTTNGAIGDRQGEAYSLSGLGEVYSQLGNYKKAIAAYQQSLKINRESGGRVEQVDCLINLGMLFLSGSSLAQSEKYLQQAKILANGIGRSNTMISLTLFQAEIDFQKGNYESAYARAERVQALAEDLQMDSQRINALLMQARIDSALQKRLKADALFKKILNRTKKLRDDHHYAITCFYYGEFLLSSNKHKRASYFFIKAEEYFKKINNRPYLEKIKLKKKA
jgi:tetratricopeptide (TPR) repeat protein